MFKLNRLGTVLLLVAFVGVAWGAANKISSFFVVASYADCFSSDDINLNMDLDASGMAILNYASGADKTIVQVIVSDFTGAPVDEFIVRLNPDVGDLGTFFVDSQGNGHFRGEVSGEVNGDVSGSNVELWQQTQGGPTCVPVLIAYGQ